MKIYNTLTRRVEEFKPQDPKVVKMYVCGPTVYDHSHVGHGRVYVFYDFLERYLRFKGYDVVKAINITDIDDKMIRRANEMGITVKELSEVMTTSFLEDYIRLNCLLPEFMPRATHHIDDMVKIISRLIEKGYAYTVNGDVYFDISKFDRYGELSHQSIDTLRAGHRIEPGEGKKDPLDFALWKSRKPGEPYWDTPWGEGRPGWHIECSAMSMKLLGETLDIHGGATDLIFPHHENEKTQSEAYSGKRFVRYWVHVGLVNFRGREMSKSTGNIVLLKEALDKYGPDTLRIMYLKTHYRSPLDFTWDKLEEARNIVDKIARVYTQLREMKEFTDEKDEEGEQLDRINRLWNNIIGALEDDLNTPLAISNLMQLTNYIQSLISRNRLTKKARDTALKYYEDIKYIFGLRLGREIDVNIAKLIELLIEVRRELRRRKEYDLADYIRDRLSQLRIKLEDRGEETIYHIT